MRVDTVGELADCAVAFEGEGVEFERQECGFGVEERAAAQEGEVGSFGFLGAAFWVVVVV